MGKLKNKKEQKRNSILKAAQDIFLSEGYILANMDKIAKKAQVTKQTVYRYFPSKEALFESTLKNLGENSGDKFIDQLNKPDTKEALYGFAFNFIQAHLSSEHLATIRLIIAENTKAPELIRSFFPIGPNETDSRLDEFFKERFQISDTEHLINMWTGMLLSLRTGVLMGLKPPKQSEVKEYAEKATTFLLKAIS